MPHLPSHALFALFVAVSSAACVTGEPEPLARGAETPAPLPEIRTAAPNPGMVWIPGAWHKDGVAETWVPGHWAAPAPVP
ncbi:MAG: YXWGXW repeat-containing protein [Minicystis sp.]